MLLTIGLKESGRELKVTTELDEKGVRELVGASTDGSADFVEFRKEDGRTLLIHPTAIAYLDFGAEAPRSVGFGSL